MKRYYLSFGMILACVLALVSCTKEIENPLENEGENNVEVEEGVPFSVFAFSDQTKTTIEGFATSWAASDAINLFHAEAATSTYVSDGSFSISSEDLSAGIFRGTLASALVGGKSYDWYAIYPYTYYASTPATRNEGSAVIGSAHNGNQTQTGNGNTSHLCATACPLYGVAKGVAASEAPSLQMHHLASILEVEVVNSTGSPLVVENISFKAPDEKIVGKFYVDITGETPVYAAKETESSDVASLVVASGEAIANGASAKFYLAVKPFTASTGETLSISVNGHEKQLVLEEDFSFNAGKVEKLKFTTNWDPVGTFLDKMLTETMYCGINYWGLRWGSKVIRVYPANDPDMKFIGHYYVDKANRTIHFTFYKDGVVRRFAPELEVVGNTLKFKQPIQYDAETTLSGFTIENPGYDHDVIKLEGMKSGWAFIDNKTWGADDSWNDTNNYIMNCSYPVQFQFKDATLTLSDSMKDEYAQCKYPDSEYKAMEWNGPWASFVVYTAEEGYYFVQYQGGDSPSPIANTDVIRFNKNAGIHPTFVEYYPNATMAKFIERFPNTYKFLFESDHIIVRESHDKLSALLIMNTDNEEFIYFPNAVK